MPTYQPVPAEVRIFIERIMTAHYPELCEADLRLRTSFAYAKIDDDGEQMDEPISIMGSPISWGLTVPNIKMRSAGAADVLLTIAGDAYLEADEKGQTALVREALDAIELQRDKEVTLKTDDLGRPKVKQRRPDVVCLVYRQSIARDKDNSPSARALIAAGREVQLTLRFAEGEVEAVA